MFSHSGDILTWQSSSDSSIVPQGEDFWPFCLLIPTFLLCVRHYILQLSVHHQSLIGCLRELLGESHMSSDCLLVWIEQKVSFQEGQPQLCSVWKPVQEAAKQAIEQMISLWLERNKNFSTKSCIKERDQCSCKNYLFPSSVERTKNVLPSPSSPPNQHGDSSLTSQVFNSVRFRT